jgi:hypothetical protein
VSQPIAAQAAATSASSRGDRRGKGHLRIATPTASDIESDDEADMNVYLNTTMFDSGGKKNAKSYTRFYNFLTFECTYLCVLS